MRRPPESTLLYRNGRRARCRTCSMPPHGGHVRVYEPDEPAASIGEVAAGVFVIGLWMFALLWAFPVLAEYIVR